MFHWTFHYSRPLALTQIVFELKHHVFTEQIDTFRLLRIPIYAISLRNPKKDSQQTTLITIELKIAKRRRKVHFRTL